MPLSQGTRVTLFLPVNDAREQDAARSVVNYLSQEVGGLTQSNIQPPVYTGYWIEDDTIFLDLISLAFFDVDQAPNEPELVTALEELKSFVHDAYLRQGSPQAEIWLTLRACSRITSP